MPNSRRRFLQAASALPASTLPGSFTFACTGGPSDGGNNFVALPEKDFLSDTPFGGIENFLDKTYGKWKYSDFPLKFRVGQIYESPYSISIGIGYFKEDPRYPSTLPYRKLDLYVQRPVYVSESVASLGQRSGYNKSLTSLVGKFEFGADTIRQIETRIQILDSGNFRLIAVFSGRGEKVEVVEQNKFSNVVRCSAVVDGYVYGKRENVF